MTTLDNVATAACARCGKPVTRKVPAGALAELAMKLAPICEACTEADAAEEREQHELEAEQARVAKVDRRVERSGLPEKFRSLTLDQLDLDPALIAAALAWVVDGGGLLLTGEVGVGKTTIAGAAARLRLERQRVIWLTAPLLFARLGSGLSSLQRDEALEVLADTTALVLDDIDKTRPTDYGAEQIFVAVDQRVAHETPLLVTSNLAPSQLADRWPEPYGEAITSRLVGYCRVVRVEGVDRRLEQAAGRRNVDDRDREERK